MKTICAWCGITLKIDQKTESVISHGICAACGEALTAGMQSQKLTSFLNAFDAPVLVVDSDGVVLGGNKKAQVDLGKESDQIRNQLGGNVMECAYSILPGGCGRTEHCKFCTLRNCITLTFQTGKCQSHVTAPMKLLVNGNPVDMRIRISTEKLNDIVLLRIEDIFPI